MSRCNAGLVTRLVSFPRVSGDEPRYDVQRTRGVAFSPRERG